ARLQGVIVACVALQQCAQPVEQDAARARIAFVEEAGAHPQRDLGARAHLHPLRREGQARAIPHRVRLVRAEGEPIARDERKRRKLHGEGVGDVDGPVERAHDANCDVAGRTRTQNATRLSVEQRECGCLGNGEVLPDGVGGDEGERILRGRRPRRPWRPDQRGDETRQGSVHGSSSSLSVGNEAEVGTARGSTNLASMTTDTVGSVASPRCTRSPMMRGPCSTVTYVVYVWSGGRTPMRKRQRTTRLRLPPAGSGRTNVSCSGVRSGPWKRHPATG